MQVTRREVAEAVAANDVDRVAEILEGYGFGKDGHVIPYFSPHRELVTIMLTHASVAFHLNELNFEMGKVLIRHTAKVVDLFPFVVLVWRAAGGERSNANNIPDLVRDALLRDCYSYDFALSVANMDCETFTNMLSFILSDEVTQLGVDFTPTLILYVYERNIIPRELLFAYMAACLKEPISEPRNPFEAFSLVFSGAMDNNKNGETEGHDVARDSMADDENVAGNEN